MSIAKRIKTLSPKLYNSIRDMKLRWKHKSWNPSKVELQNGNRIYVDWKEPRGHAILRTQAKGQPEIKSFWRCTMLEYDPDIIIDCGANYGELIFSGRYRQDQFAVGVEANPVLYSWLSKSHSAHPDRERIHIVNALISSEVGDDTTFYVDNQWSGRSTAITDHGFTDFREVQVKMTSIDNLLLDVPVTAKKLFFKIDVEGYEPYVLQGMLKVLSQVSSAIGIMEFNPEYLSKVQYSLDSYLNMINKHFSVVAEIDQRLVAMPNLDSDNIHSITGDDIVVHSTDIDSSFVINLLTR